MQANFLHKTLERELHMIVDELVLTQVLADLGYKTKIGMNDLFYLLNYNKDENAN